MKNQSRSWADLQPELLSSIYNRFDGSRLLLQRFRAVCRSWRSSCPLPPHDNLLSPLYPYCIPSRILQVMQMITMVVNIIFSLQAQCTSSKRMLWNLLLRNSDTGWSWPMNLIPEIPASASVSPSI